MRYFKWVFIFFIMVGFSGAAQTFTDTHDFGCEGLIRDFESRKLTDNLYVDWTHTLPGFDGRCSITEATLTINGRGIDNICWDFDGDFNYEQTDYVAVEFMGHDLGLLSGNSTTFDLMPYQDLIESITNASAEITFQNDLMKIKSCFGSYYVDWDCVDSVYLSESILTVVCEPPIPPSMVPAPSAIVLGALGICLVGWLRKRSVV